MKKIFHRNETYLTLVIVLYCFVVQMSNSMFFSVTTVVNILNNMIVTGIFALGMLLVILSGSIDVSFASLVALASYTGVQLFINLGSENGTANVIGLFIFVTVSSIILSMINGYLIGYLKLPSLIITLGTMNISYGFLMGVMDATAQNRLPIGINEYGRKALLTVQSMETGRSASLNYSFLIMIALVILTSWILKYTMLGRGIYAVGGNETAARKSGYNVKRIKLFAFCYLGALAGIAGTIKICNIRYNAPEILVGSEMDVIAAVVLGGASLSGGKGTVFGTMLAVTLITIVNNSLNFLGVSGYWQSLFTGLIIVIGTSVTSYQSFLSGNRVAKA